MLNNPNEWHNEDDDMSKDLLGDDYFDFGDDSEVEDFSDDGEYEEDDAYSEVEDFSDDGEYEEDDAYSEEEDFSGEDDSEVEEYEETEDFDENFEDNGDDEEYEEDDDDEDSPSPKGSKSGDDGLKKKLIMASAILLIFLVFMGGIFGMRGMKNSKAKKADSIAAVSTTEKDKIGGEETDILIEEELPEDKNLSAKKNNEDEEVLIDIEVEDDSTANKAETKKPEDKADKTEKTAQDEKGTVLVEEEDEKNAVKAEDVEEKFTGKPGETVTIAIGDVGRKNPFMPTGEMQKQESKSVKVEETYSTGLDFPVIEPPQLSAKQENIVKLLNTRVSGILYDSQRPSAIININGVDQLVRKGDVLSGFEMLGIDQDKVVIRSDNNIYKASIGQPLNSEKVVNMVEISNLNSKFAGSRNR